LATKSNITEYCFASAATSSHVIRETLYRLALPRATRKLALELGALGDDAAIVGLSRLVVDQEYSAAAVNARLG
jgi:hypothetical protein